MSKIDIINIDDWYGLYLDGKLVSQDHRLQPEVLLDKLEIPYTSRYIEVTYDQEKWWDGMPSTLEEIDD